MKRPIYLAALTLAASTLACDPPDLYTDPVAQDDTYQGTRASPVVTGDVRTNDLDPDGRELGIIAWSQGAKGDVTYNGDGTFTWSPRASIPSGTDSFTYTVLDDQGGTSSATVTITIAESWGLSLRVGDAVTRVLTLPDAQGYVNVVWTEWDGARYSAWAARRGLDGAWSAPTQVDAPASTYDATSLTAALAPTGDLLVAWLQSDGSRLDLWANRMVVDPAGPSVVTWGTPANVDSEELGDALAPAIVGASAGHFTMAWMQWNGAVHNLWAARLPAGGSWSAATLLEANAGTVNTTPMLLVDVKRAVTALWSQVGTTYYDLWARRAAPDGTWGSAVKLDLLDGSDVFFANTVQLDSLGNLLVVWEQSDGVRYNLYYARMTDAGVWSATALLETEDLGSAQFNRVIVDSQRNMTVLWQQSNGTVYNLWARRMSSAGAWGTATKYEADEAHAAYFLDAAVDSNRNVIVLFQLHDGTRYNLHANRMGPGGTWETARLLENEDFGSVGTARLAVHGADATAVWAQSDGTVYNLWSARLPGLTGTWTTAQKIEQEARSVYRLYPLTDATGRLIVAWNTRDIPTNTYRTFATVMAPDGSWSPTVELEPEEPGSSSRFPVVTLGQDGFGAVAWTRTLGPESEIRISRIDPGGIHPFETPFVPPDIVGNPALTALVPLPDEPPLCLTRSPVSPYSYWLGDFR